MKKLIFYLCLVVPVCTYAQTDYYWYKGKKISLEKIDTKSFLLFDLDNVDSIKTKQSFARKGIKTNVLNESNILNGLNPSKKQPAKNKEWAVVNKKQLDSIKSGDANIAYEGAYYRTTKNIEAGISHLFYVKLKEAQDVGLLTSLANKNRVEILGNNTHMPLWYTLSCSKNSNGNALQMANCFYETGLFAASEPDLMAVHVTGTVNDTYYNYQWGLNNTGQYGGSSNIDINYPQASSITQGSSNIIIAVVDQGVELNHPDLTNMASFSYDMKSKSSPSVTHDNHGTAVAGIIGAKNNNSLGITGIAPYCPIMSVSGTIEESIDGSQMLADGIHKAWKNNASVINCSWYAYESQLLEDAIDSALYKGRGGLGCVVVFAAGNENDSEVFYPGSYNDDIIVVGAISPCGQRKSPSSCDTELEWGSNYGQQLDIMAPGVLIPTTDRQDDDGYNPDFNLHSDAGNNGTLALNDFSNTDYTIWFSGTSAAAPHVSAVAGLILSQDPTLTREQVTDIIESTAQKVGGYTYQTNSGRPNGTWNIEMGYGLLDAYAAVNAVCVKTKITDKTYTTHETINGCDVNIQNVTVLNNSKLTINATNEITIAGPFNVELGSELELNTISQQ